jgi:hypothetical protein
MENKLELGESSGLLIQAPRPTDFIVGGEDYMIGADIINPSGNWDNYYSKGERQSGVYFDSMACASFSANNIIEARLNFQLRNNQLPPAIVTRCIELGYIVDNEFNFSDRFLAKVSGTTRTGNYFVNVWDAIRKYGLVPEKMWTYDPLLRTPAFDWDDYYAPIPQAVYNSGLEFLKMFDVTYAWLLAGGSASDEQYQSWLKVSPVQLGVGTCSGWNSGAPVKACGSKVNHAIALSSVDGDKKKIVDHYVPFVKELEAGYAVPFAIRGIASPRLDYNGGINTPIDSSFGKRFSGKMLLAAEARGELWYVTPSGQRVKIGQKPEEVATFLKAVNDKKVPTLGMTNANLDKIAIIE